MNFWHNKTKIFALIFLLFACANVSLYKAQNSIYQLQPGTKIVLRMDNEINSKVSSVDDTFTATIAKPLIVREAVVLPVGTVFEGRITKIERAATGGQGGKMEVKFESLRFADGNKREIDGVLVNRLEAESTTKSGIITVLGTTAVGALFGAVSKAENGALLGAGIGAGAGTGIALLRKGKEVRIKSDEEFEIELKREVILPVLDY